MASVLRTGALLACALSTFVLLSQPAVAEQDTLAWRDAKSIDALRVHLEDWLDKNTDLSRSQRMPIIRQINVEKRAGCTIRKRKPYTLFDLGISATHTMLRFCSTNSCTIVRTSTVIGTVRALRNCRRIVSKSNGLPS